MFVLSGQKRLVLSAFSILARGGVMNSPIAPIGIARRMILAIVTSREFYPGNFKWFHCAKLFRGVKGLKWRRCDETTEGMCLYINAM